MSDDSGGRWSRFFNPANWFAGTAKREIDRLREALERCDRVFHFDLRRMVEFGPDYNQAVKDAAGTVREALRGR